MQPSAVCGRPSGSKEQQDLWNNDRAAALDFPLALQRTPNPDRLQRLTLSKDLQAMLLDRITIDPAICHGKPTVRGLRYPVDTILDLLSSGMSHEEILADYEDLEPDDLLAVLAFAAQLSRVKRVQAVR